jgi:hypothetical protein
VTCVLVSSAYLVQGQVGYKDKLVGLGLATECRVTLHRLLRPLTAGPRSGNGKDVRA